MELLSGHSGRIRSYNPGAYDQTNRSHAIVQPGRIRPDTPVTGRNIILTVTGGRKVKGVNDTLIYTFYSKLRT